MAKRDKTRIAVIGAGRFGARRARAVVTSAESELGVVADVSFERARCVGEGLGCSFTTDWKQAATRDDVDAVVVSTPTRFLSEVSLVALEAGKHVLCEKPFGRTAEEVLPVVEAAARKGLRLKVGYNHRYHPALAKAYALYRDGAIGNAMFLRCHYGHGGRPGYETEWRTNPELAGGGELLDQGVHLLDLLGWFLGEFEEVTAYVGTRFWPIAPVEDNVFALLRTPNGCVASLHASWTNWKNAFSFEVFGERGYLAAEGLGGSYGCERLCWGERGALGAVPRECVWEFGSEDCSLECEWEGFLQCIWHGQEPLSSGEEGWRTLQLAEAIYRAARERRTVPVRVAEEWTQAAHFGERVSR